MSKNYAVVKFLDENDVLGIICKQWMTSKSVCLYPNVKTNEDRDKLLKQQATTEKSWLSCRIEVIKEYTSFRVACSKLREAEIYSHLESESDSESMMSHPRKRIKKNHLYPGESESESDEELVEEKKKLVCLPYTVPPKDNPAMLLPESSYTSNSQASQTQSEIFSPSADPSLQSQLFTPSADPALQSQLISPTSTILSQLINPECERPSQDQTVLNEKLVAWMANICEKVNQVDEKLNMVLENQAKILNCRMSERSEDFEELKVLGILPVEDDSSFLELNKKIAEDNRARNFLIKVLISVGGKDMRCHIQNMLRRILTDDVAELYNLTGKIMQNSNSKKSFTITNVAKSIFVACQRIHKEKATEVGVREVIGEWLHQAKTRKTRRMQRQEKHVRMDIVKVEIED